TVNRSGPKALQSFKVNGGRVAFVAAKAVAGIDQIKRLHFAVTADLGQYRRSRDCRHLRIARTDRRTGDRQLRTTVTVDQRQFRPDSKTLYSALHGQHGCVEDIEAVDLLNFGTGDAPGQGLFANLVE